MFDPLSIALGAILGVLLFITALFEVARIFGPNIENWKDRELRRLQEKVEQLEAQNDALTEEVEELEKSK